MLDNDYINNDNHSYEKKQLFIFFSNNPTKVSDLTSNWMMMNDDVTWRGDASELQKPFGYLTRVGQSRGLLPGVPAPGSRFGILPVRPDAHIRVPAASGAERHHGNANLTQASRPFSSLPVN